MASAFDPSAFLEAENSRNSAMLAALAGPARMLAGDDGAVETAVFCGVERHSEPTLATIAALAAPGPVFCEMELSWLRRAPCPAGIDPVRWDELVEESWSISRAFGHAAVAAGWTVLDLFGCNHDLTARRVDRNGLVATVCALLTPVRVTALTATHADLTDARGSIMRFRPPVGDGAVPLWVAAGMKTGP